MPRGRKIDDEIGSHEVLPDETAPANSKGAKLRQFLDRIANVQASIDSTMNEAKLECAPFQQDIKEIKKEANEAGFSAKELNTVIRKERLEHRLENIAENLDDEQKERFEDMLHALGALADLPLGKHIAEQHPDAGTAAH